MGIGLDGLWGLAVHHNLCANHLAFFQGRGPWRMGPCTKQGSALSQLSTYMLRNVSAAVGSACLHMRPDLGSGGLNPIWTVVGQPEILSTTAIPKIIGYDMPTAGAALRDSMVLEHALCQCFDST